MTLRSTAWWHAGTDGFHTEVTTRRSSGYSELRRPPQDLGTGRRARIEHLLCAGELELVTPDDSVAQRLIANASKHLEIAAAGMATDDLAGAYQLVYDALRKSAAALLAAQGHRRPVAVGTSPFRTPSARLTGRVNSTWPQVDGLKWPHLAVFGFGRGRVGRSWCRSR